MTDFTQTQLQEYIIHKLGSKINKEGVTASSFSSDGNKNQDYLLKFFLSPFGKTKSFYRFYDEIDITANSTYCAVYEIFNQKESLKENSLKLAKMLYNVSDHPKIKPSDFYVVHFTDVLLDEGELVDAIGIFKTDEQNTFIQVNQLARELYVEVNTGVEISKLSKGCIIYNTNEADGYIIELISEKNEFQSKYFNQYFLGIKSIDNKYLKTQTMIEVLNNFIKNPDYNFSVPEKIAFKEKTHKFLKENETFEIDDYAEQILADKETIDVFKEHIEGYEEDKEIIVAKDFKISEEAVKKNKKHFKSVIKLDKNFHIYVHGNKQMIETGYNVERGQGYYKLYFNEEK